MRFWQSLSFTETAELVPLARTCEEVGFHGVFVSDHLFHPEKLASRYPYSEDGRPGFEAETPFPDPLATLAAMAAVTRRLRLGPMVYILPLRNPIEVAKTAGTVARNWGLHGSPVACLERLLTRPRRRVLRPSLQIDSKSGDDNARRIGFIVGTGLVARFFRLYYQRGAPG